MRKVELLQLKKEDIDFKNRTILVQSAKSNKIRYIYIDLKLTIILYLYCRKLKHDELLFKFHSAYVSIYFHKTIVNSKLKQITFHDIRHIYASFLLANLKNNANALFIVQRQLRSCNCNRNSYDLCSCFKYSFKTCC